LVSAEARRAAGEAWAFRARVEREAALRFDRLAAAIGRFDEGSPVPAQLSSAARDEDRHAALCEKLARECGATSGLEGSDARIAPGGLSERDAALYEIVAACCLTETESVATLTALLGSELDATIRDAVHEIARDEVGHSRMGWAHLAREAAARDVSFLGAFIPAMLAGGADPALFQPAAEPDGLLALGVLPRAMKREVFVRALEDVVFPGLEKFGVDCAPARAWLARQPMGDNVTQSDTTFSS
jgi:hypothetical protein